MEKKFRSKIDGWIFVLLVIALASQIYVVVQIVPEQLHSTHRYVVLGTVVLTFLLILSILLRTYNLVDRERIRIVCGPFWWTVQLSDITSVAATHNPLSSPALSLDRVRINYGNNKRVMVSPADKAGFYDAIGRAPISE